MTFRLFTGHSSNDYGEISYDVSTATLGYVNGTISGKYFTGFSASIDYQNYTDVLVDLATSMNSIMVGSTTQLRLDQTTRKIILWSDTTANWNFGSAAQKILGFDAFYSNTAVITGSVAPGFIWVSTYEQRTNDSGLFEDTPDFTERVADSGRSYSVGKTSTVPNRNWDHGLEPKENVFIDRAVGLYPWEQFIKDVRKGPYYFVVMNDKPTYSLNYADRDGTYQLIADRYKFDPKQVVPGFFDYWNITDIKTRLYSRPNQIADDQFDTLPVTGSFLAKQGNLIHQISADLGAGIVMSGPTIEASQYFDGTIYKNSSSIDTNTNIIYNPSTAGIMNSVPTFMFTSSVASRAPYVASASYPLATLGTPTGFTFIANIQLIPYASSSATKTTNDIYFNDIVNTGNSFAYRIDSDARKISTYISGNNGSQYIATSSVFNVTASDKLMLMTTVDKSTGLSKFYINGIKQTVSKSIGAGMLFTGPGYETKFSDDPFASTNKFHAYHLTDYLVYGNALSSSNLNAIQNYYGNKYGIGYTPIEDENLPPYAYGLVFFGDLNNPNTKITNGLVERYGDSSGRNNHFTQSNVSRQPTYTANNPLFGGKPSMYFDGGDSLQLTNIKESMQNTTIYFVMKIISYSGLQSYIIQIGNTANREARLYYQAIDKALFALYCPTGADYSYKYFTIPSGSISRVAGSGKISQGGDLWNSYINGVASSISKDTKAAANPGTLLGPVTIGANSAGSNGVNIILTDVLIFNEAHDATQVAAVDNWLKIRNKQ